MRTCARRTGGPGDVGVAGQTPASTIHAEERARHALTRTVTQYAARSWLPVASTIRACTHGNRSAGGTGAPCGQHNPRVCARSNLRASSATSLAFKHNPRACTQATAPVPPIRCLVSAQSARMRAQQPTCQLGHVICVQAQSTHLRARQPHQSYQSTAWHQHNPRVCAHNSAGSSSMMPAVMRYGPHTRTRDNSQRCFLSPSRDTPPVAHDTAAPPPQHVSCMKMRYASWLD